MSPFSCSCGGSLSSFLGPDQLCQLLVAPHAVLFAPVRDAGGNFLPTLGAQAGRISLQSLLQQLLLVGWPRCHVKALGFGSCLGSLRRLSIVNLKTTGQHKLYIHIIWWCSLPSRLVFSVASPSSHRLSNSLLFSRSSGGSHYSVSEKQTLLDIIEDTFSIPIFVHMS